MIINNNCLNVEREHDDGTKSISFKTKVFTMAGDETDAIVKIPRCMINESGIKIYQDLDGTLVLFEIDDTKEKEYEGI